MSDIDLGAELYRMGGLEMLKGHPAFDPLIKEARVRREQDRERLEERRAWRKSDLEFERRVVREINSRGAKSDTWLVLVPGPVGGYLDVLRRDVAASTTPEKVTRDRIEYSGPLVVHFASDEKILRSSCGRAYDHILLHDDVSWRAYVAVMPCLRR